MPTTSETIDIDGCKLVVRSTGKGQPLLWLHGTDGLSEWPVILDRLAERYEVIAPDHPGFGESTIPGWMDDVSDLAYLYLDLMKRLDLKAARVVGHSLGGWIGLEMAVLTILAEPWWRVGLSDVRVLATRIPAQWGAEFHLYGNSMNPVMTAHLMRAGRMAHRSPYLRGLYLAGSATHPGQWVSFAAISGILAADALCEDQS